MDQYEDNKSGIIEVEADHEKFYGDEKVKKKGEKLLKWSDFKF